MAPKGKNVDGGVVLIGQGRVMLPVLQVAELRFKSLARDCNLTLVGEFYVNWITETRYNKSVPIHGKTVRFTSKVLNVFLGTPQCDADDYNRLKETPPYRDIRHTLCGVDSTARWDQSKDTGRHATLHYANLNQVARVWLKIVCSVLLLEYVEVHNNKWWKFCYGSLITRFLRAKGIEEESLDMTIARAPYLVCNLVDMSHTKAQDMSHGPALSVPERQARDNSWMARMFGMLELHLQIGIRPVTDEEMESLAERYPLTDNAPYMCRMGPHFMSRSMMMRLPMMR
ncbi:hypothetical protein KY284_037652 [Solanum tuberosum]|nr:hypothetical protein KY284_037652 [Solanum tuberosum]